MAEWFRRRPAEPLNGGSNPSPGLFPPNFRKALKNTFTLLKHFKIFCLEFIEITYFPYSSGLYNSIEYN